MHVLHVPSLKKPVKGLVEQEESGSPKTLILISFSTLISRRARYDYVPVDPVYIKIHSSFSLALFYLVRNEITAKECLFSVLIFGSARDVSLKYWAATNKAVGRLLDCHISGP